MPGLQYTPMGIFPLTPDGSVPVPPQRGNDVAGGAVVRQLAASAQTQSVHIVHAVPAANAKTAAVAVTDLSPKDVIRLARKRLRDIDKQLKQLAKLQVEREQLKRLLDAADGKLGVVRKLSTVG